MCDASSRVLGSFDGMMRATSHGWIIYPGCRLTERIETAYRLDVFTPPPLNDQERLRSGTSACSRAIAGPLRDSSLL